MNKESNVETIEFTDRYSALGIKRPNLLTMCRAHCEATGYVPVFLAEGSARTETPSAILMEDEQDPRLVAAWQEAEQAHPTDDGWHFVTCPDCKGTGRTRGFWPRFRQVGFWLRKKAEFARSHVVAKPYTSGTAALALMMQRDAAMSAFEVGSGPQPWDGMTPYGDRLDVPRPWWWNRRIALRVLIGWPS